MDNLNDYIAADGRITQSFPAELFSDKDAVLRLLHEMRNRVGKICPADEHSDAPYVVDRPVDNIIRAVEADCLSVEDMRDIFTKPIQFHQMLGYLNEAADTAPVQTVVSESVDTLLFALELAIADVDRLRGSRVRFEIASILANRMPLDVSGVDPKGRSLSASEITEMLKQGEVKPEFRLKFQTQPIPIDERRSPRQILASWAWEKKIRNDKRFKHESRYVLGRVQSNFGKEAPYWMFSMTPRFSETKFLFYAFDANFQFDLKASQDVTDSLLAGEFTDHQYPVSLDNTPLDNNVLWQLCRKYSLGMVGTPFLNPPLYDELHILAQQVLVTGKDNAIHVRIPAFYQGHNLGSLLDTDFSDLQRVIAGDTQVESYGPVRNPDMNTCPLGDQEMGDALKAAHKALKKRGLSREASYQCVHKLAALWWTGKSGQSSGNMKNKKTSAGTAAEVDSESVGRLSRFIRTPERMASAGHQYTPPSRDEIIRLVQQEVGKCRMPSRYRYAWAKLYRELLRAKQI